MLKTLDASCKASTVSEVMQEVRGFFTLGHLLYAYAYLRMLHYKDPNLYYAALWHDPAFLLPIVYTPTVGEACQKFGLLPFFPRGCYVSICDCGRVKEVLLEYAEAMLTKDENGKFECQCIVFSDAGRILGLGDLGCWGMGIPIGKLDLYTVCAGFNPYKTVPVIIDAGCTDASGNSAKLTIRDHELYTGLKQDRMKHEDAQGTEVNTAYYGPCSLIGEFMAAAADIFSRKCLLQFEDFNTNDAFPLLEEYRHKFLSYNDDIQGTAAVVVAAVLGGIRLQKPGEEPFSLRAMAMAVDLFMEGPPPELQVEEESPNSSGARLLGALSLSGLLRAQSWAANSMWEKGHWTSGVGALGAARLRAASLLAAKVLSLFLLDPCGALASSSCLLFLFSFFSFFSPSALGQSRIARACNGSSGKGFLGTRLSLCGTSLPSDMLDSASVLAVIEGGGIVQLGRGSQRLGGEAPAPDDKAEEDERQLPSREPEGGQDVREKRSAPEAQRRMPPNPVVEASVRAGERACLVGRNAQPCDAAALS
ncbi:Me3 [Symbiodinium microadriaticum]|nr:Me3 [Symbiodinium microadriaticum]